MVARNGYKKMHADVGPLRNVSHLSTGSVDGL